MTRFKNVTALVFSTCVLLSLSLLSISCTRALPETSATVKLGMPLSDGSGSLAISAILSHIVINVTGPGINTPVFISWDKNSGGTTAPTSFVVDIPTGSARLFQALLVFDDPATGAMSFYYGDVLQAVDANTNSVTIVANTLSNTVAGDGQIAGRVLKTSNSGYTGRVAMRFAPASGRPPMLIETSEVFNGWFSVFALEGIAFNYTLDDGTELFGKPVGLDDAMFGQDASSVVVTVPDHWESHGDPADPRELRRASLNVFGWFGPGVSGQTVCYYDDVIDIPYAYQNDAPDMTLIQWDSYDAVLAGGDADAALDGDGQCVGVGTTRFADYLSVDPEEVAHHDGTLGFRGPFQRVDYSSNGGGFLDYMYDGDVNLAWLYLPDVVASADAKGIYGADVFMRILPVGYTGSGDDYGGDNNNTNCAALPSLGFALKGSVAQPAESFSFTPDAGFATADNDGRVQIVLCPYSTASGTKKYFGSTIDYRSYGMVGSMDVQFDSVSSAVIEGSTGSVVVSLSSPSASDVTVSYSTSDLSATAVADYTSFSGTLTIPAGSTSVTIAVTTTQDAMSEGDEDFEISISSPSGGYSLGGRSNHTVTITDDDFASPTLVFASASDNVIESAGAKNVNITLSGGIPAAITVDYSVTGGTASGAGTDYVLAAGTLTIPAFSVSENISLAIIDDVISEADETIEITISNPTNASLGGQLTHTLTINDNDGLPDVDFATATGSTNENLSPANIVVTLTNPSSFQITANYTVTQNTAISSLDYTFAAGTVTFSPGMTSLTLHPTIIDDALSEGAEDFSLTLTGVNAYADLGVVNTTHTHTINDNEVAVTATKFVILNPTDGIAGTAVTVTVQAQDAGGSIDTSYNSDVTLNVDGSATGGGLVDIVSGTGTITINDLVAQTVNLSVTDSQATGLTVSSTQNVVFSSGVLSSFTVTGITDPIVAGVNTSPVVTAYDIYGNVKTNYVGTITFTSDDGAAVLPASYTFLGGDAGVHTFTSGVQLRTTGEKYVQVADGAVNGQQANITVIPGAAASLVWATQPASVTANTPLTPVIIILDTYGNILLNDNTSVITLTIFTNPGSSVLSGTVFLTVSGGVATWSSGQALTLNNPSTGYMLQASDGVRTSYSAPFNAL